jgi:hypothetical protein
MLDFSFEEGDDASFNFGTALHEEWVVVEKVPLAHACKESSVQHGVLDQIESDTHTWPINLPNSFLSLTKHRNSIDGFSSYHFRRTSSKLSGLVVIFSGKLLLLLSVFSVFSAFSLLEIADSAQISNACDRSWAIKSELFSNSNISDIDRHFSVPSNDIHDAS